MDQPWIDHESTTPPPTFLSPAGWSYRNYVELLYLLFWRPHERGDGGGFGCRHALIRGTASQGSQVVCEVDLAGGTFVGGDNLGFV